MPSPANTSGIHWAEEAAFRSLSVVMRPLQCLMTMPTALFFLALLAMLLRHPDVSFYEIDRIAFALLVFGVIAGELAARKKLWVVKSTTWPMIGLSLLAIASAISQPFDARTWSLLAAKFIVPFALFHLALIVFRNERRLEHFEFFCLVILAYLCFTSIAFLAGAHFLIFPRFILDESLGYHVDRARGPLLQAVANGVSLNILGLLALHAALRRKIRGLKAALLLTSLPVAILATLTRAVWLSFSASVVVLIFRSDNRKFMRVCVVLVIVTAVGLLVVLSFDDQRRTFTDRFRESEPIAFREAVYSGGWQMFLEKPLTGWGVNRMPTELARHVSGYSEKELYPHNTYLELLVEHGILGLGLYMWLMWELLKLGWGTVPRSERNGLLSQRFHVMWPIILGIYYINACVVVMNYQFVNGLLFTMAGMLAAQQHRAQKEMQHYKASPLYTVHASLIYPLKNRPL